MLDRMRHRPLRERRDQQIGHALRHLAELRGESTSRATVEAGLAGVKTARRIQPHDAADVVDHLQPAPDMQPAVATTSP